MDNEKFNLPILNQEELGIMNNRITSMEIEAVTKNLPKNKSPGPDGFTGEFCQTFREELMLILLKLFQKIAEERTLPNSFYKASITLTPKTSPKKDTQRQHKKRKLQANIMMKTDAKILNKILANNSTTHQKAPSL